MVTRTQLKTNFVAGELDPKLISRSDIQQYYNAAEKIRNAIVLPQGGAVMRPGSRYLWQVPDVPNGDGGGTSNVRLAEFIFNTEQTYLLLFYHENVAIFVNGSLVATVDMPYSSDDLVSSETSEGDLISSGIWWTQSKDTLVIFHQDYQPRILKRDGSDSDWDVSTLFFKNIPRFDFGEDYTDPDEIGVDEVQTINFPNPGDQGDWTAGDTFALIVEDEDSDNIEFSTDADTMAVSIRAALRSMPNVAAGNVTVTHSGASGADTEDVDFTVTFTNNNGSRPWGSIYYTTISAEQVPTIDIVIETKGQYPGEEAISNARGWPRCGMFAQGRLWMAGSTSLPHYIWATRSGSFEDMNSELFADDYGIVIPADTGDVPAFTACYAGRHLQFFSKSGEFYIPPSENQAVTPGNVALRRTSSYGVKPGLRVYDVDGATHFVQRGGGALREFIFTDTEQAYQSPPLSLLSSHLMLNPSDFALRRAKSTTDADYEFLVNNDGSMTVFCTLRTQDVNAMTLWRTQGAYVGVGVVLDEVYFAVQRNINGTPTVFLEVMDDSLTVDCGIYIEGGNLIDTGTLAHLPNQTLDNLIDGIIREPVVTDGSGNFTLSDDPSSSIMIGYRFATPDFDYPDFTWFVKTLPIEMELADGASLGRKRRLSGIFMRLVDTEALIVDETRLSFRDFGGDVLDEKIAPFTGIKRLRGRLGWDFDGAVIIGGDQSLKGGIISLALKVSI